LWVISASGRSLFPQNHRSAANGGPASRGPSNVISPNNLIALSLGGSFCSPVSSPQYSTNLRSSVLPSPPQLSPAFALGDQSQLSCLPDSVGPAQTSWFSFLPAHPSQALKRKSAKCQGLGSNHVQPRTPRAIKKKDPLGARDH
jgi:hypothetical protein